VQVNYCLFGSTCLLIGWLLGGCTAAIHQTSVQRLNPSGHVRVTAPLTVTLILHLYLKGSIVWAVLCTFKHGLEWRGCCCCLFVRLV